MHSKGKSLLISGPAVGCMLFVAWSEFAHGKPAGEVHLITSAPITVGSSVVFTGVGFHNAIIEADYVAPPDSRPLPHDGLTDPST